MTKRILALCAVLGLVSSFLIAQSKPSIQGAWRRVETTVTNPNPAPDALPKGTHTNVQPGLLIFTAKHYSVQIDGAAKPRPAIKNPAKPTAEELNAAWGPYVANSGTYELSGSTLTMRQIVAKNPANQGKSVTKATIKIEKDNLWFSLIENSGGKIEYPNTIKYVRIE